MYYPELQKRNLPNEDVFIGVSVNIYIMNKNNGSLYNLLRNCKNQSPRSAFT